VNSGPNITAAISKIAVIDLRTGRYRFLPAELSSTLVKTLAVTPNGRSVVGATIHGDTSVWNTGSGVISQTIAAPVGAIGIAALDPAGRTLLIGSRDGSVTAFDLSGSRRLGRAFQWNTPNQSCVTSPCFAVDRLGDVMAVTQGDGSVATIDLHTLRRTATLPARNGPLATAIAFFPDGRTLLTGGSAGRITLWDVRSHRVLRTIGVGAPVMGGTVSPDGRLIAVQTQAPGSTGSLVEVRPAAGGRPIWSAAGSGRRERRELQSQRPRGRSPGMLHVAVHGHQLGCTIRPAAIRPAAFRSRDGDRLRVRLAHAGGRHRERRSALVERASRYASRPSAPRGQRERGRHVLLTGQQAARSFIDR
ncbi:MAG: WD40 repeat domain-containing protein, partial [Solirubrobacterales bacterium]|nr:WD40 repeat domain-containing protein [Solirubrobacterales bacterium]